MAKNNNKGSYPITRTLFASAKKSPRFVPIRERQKTAISTVESRSGTCEKVINGAAFSLLAALQIKALLLQ